MTTLTNPFPVYYYAGSEYFCGREKEQATLLSALRNGRNVTLMSERRMGKTGMIKNLFEKLSKERHSPVCIYVDVFATKSLDDFVRVLAANIIGKFDKPLEKAMTGISAIVKSGKMFVSYDPVSGNPQLGLDFQPSEAKHTLTEIFTYLRSINNHVYLAIDEFQQIATYAESGIEALLREQMQFSSNVHFIFSGSKQHLMNEIFTSPSRPFYRSTDKLPLGTIPRQQYSDFARTFFTKAKRDLPEDIFYELYDRFEGHTWYVQYTLNRLWESDRKIITYDDINKAIQEIIDAENDNFRNIYDGLTENQASLLRAIAKDGIVGKINSGDFIKKHNLATPSSINRALKFLLDKELVYKQQSGYRVYDRFLQLWLQQLYL